MSRRPQSAPEGTSTIAALSGRKKPDQGKEPSDAALGHASQNTSTTEAAKEEGDLPKGWEWKTIPDVNAG